MSHPSVSLTHSEVVFSVGLARVWVFFGAQKLVNDIYRLNVKLVCKMLLHSFQEFFSATDELVLVQAIEVLVPPQRSETELIQFYTVCVDCLSLVV